MAIVTLVLATVAAAQAGSLQPLNLTCRGGGTANKSSSATVRTDSHVSGIIGTNIVSGNGDSTSTVRIPRQQGFGDQVDVRLFTDDDRIRMPRTMLPAFHGGSDGWFRLKDVVADARTIRASVYVSFINRPKLYIDRVTGTISISGKSGDYSGQCDVIDADAAPKF